MGRHAKLYGSAFAVGVGAFALAVVGGIYRSLRSERRLPRVELGYLQDVSRLVDEERFDVAIPQLRLALRIEPDAVGRPLVLTRLGDALARSGDAQAAARAYSEAAALDPNAVEALFGLGVALEDLGRLEEAAGAYAQALDADPGHSRAHNNLGILRFGAGDAAGGVEHMRRALALDPDYAEAHHNLAVMLWAQGTRDEAIAHLEEALRIDPDYANARAKLERMRAETGG